MEIWVSEDEQEGNLSPVLVGWQDEFPQGHDEVGLEVMDDVDLLPYLERGARVEGFVTGTIPPDDVEVGGEVTLSIRVIF